jgi:hypothetical protein
VATGSSAAAASADLCLRDLCRDTLAFVAAQSIGQAAGGGGGGVAASAQGQQQEDQQQPPPQHQDEQAPLTPANAADNPASTPPQSPKSADGDGIETINERSPLKGSRGRRSSSGSSGNGGGGGRAGSSSADAGDRLSIASRRRSLLGGLLPSVLSAAGGDGGQQQAASLLLLGGDDRAAAPIVDIGAVFGSDPVPEGFQRIATTPAGRRADLNAGAGGHYIYLTLKKDPTRRRPPVVALALIFPDRQEFVPPTFRYGTLELPCI